MPRRTPSTLTPMFVAAARSGRTLAGLGSASLGSASLGSASLAFASLAFAGLGFASLAAAQDAGALSCDGPLLRRPVEVTPTVNARSVSTDAPVLVRYSPDYFGPTGPGGDPAALITVHQCPEGCGVPCPDTGVFVPGLVQQLGDVLSFVPNEAWAPRSGYAGIARGVDEDLPFSFCTGTEPDLADPQPFAIGSVTSTPVNPRCDAPSGGYRIAVRFQSTNDGTGPPGSIEYLLFQTRGGGLDAPRLRDRLRNFTTGETTMAFVLPPEEAAAVICLAVAAVDGVGNVTLSRGAQGSDTCIDPVQGNFFAPLCAVSEVGLAGSGAGVEGAPPGLVLLAVGLVLAWVGRRGRRPRRRPASARKQTAHAVDPALDRS